MIFEDNLKIKYSEMDYKLALKPSALLNFLQDLASENAEQLGFGYSYIRNRNLMWFIIKYRMEFTDYPVSVYDLTIKTEPRGCNKLFAFRDFWLYEGDKMLAQIASTWSLVDINSKSIVPPQNALNNEYMLAFEKRESDLNYKKIRPLEKIDISKTFEIRYDDIDVNCHANNGNYIIWAFEPLSFEFKSSHKLKILDIQFKKEIKFGQKVLSEIEFKDEKTTVHVIKNSDTGEDLCLVEAVWTENK